MINVSFSVSHINDEFMNNYANVAFDFIKEKIKANSNMWQAIKTDIKSNVIKEYNNAVIQKNNNPNTRKYDEIIKNNPNNVNFDESKSIINILDKHLTNKIEILKTF